MTGLLVVVAAVLGISVFGTKHTRTAAPRVQRQPRSKAAPAVRAKLAVRESTNTDLTGLQLASSFLAIVMVFALGMVVLGLVNLNYWGLTIGGAVVLVVSVTVNRRVAKARSRRVQLRRTAPVARKISLPNLAVDTSPMSEAATPDNDRAWTPVEIPMPKHLVGSLEQPTLAPVRAIGAPIEGAELDEILRRRRSAG